MRDRQDLSAAAYASRHLGTDKAPPCGCEPDLASEFQRSSIAALGANPVDATADRPYERELRRTLRRGYGCDCCGDASEDAAQPDEQTRAVLEVVEAWTGMRCRGCPWRALSRPIVHRVFAMYRAYDKGQLALVRPDPSHREVEAVMYLQQLLQRMDLHQIELDRKQRANRGEDE